MKNIQFFVKRVMDILVSGVGLLILSPLICLIAILIRIDSPGPVFYLQERVGKDKKLFRMWKFRTMITGAEKMGLGIDVVEGDERITRIGNFLRRWCLDELPQLINVFKGEMSLVGPRPTVLCQVEKYTPCQMKRLDVKPGMTGLAQVKGRNMLTWQQRIEYDIQYVENYSIWLDLWILALTPFILMRSDIVYSLPKAGVNSGEENKER